jgi:hypothetical protein
MTEPTAPNTPDLLHPAPATATPTNTTWLTVGKAPALTRYELIKLILLGAFVLFFIIGGTIALLDLNHITQPFDFVNSYLPLLKEEIANQTGVMP